MARSDGPAARVRRARTRRAEQAMQPAALPATPTEIPVDTERGTLYTADQLYGSGPYAASCDAQVYAWSLVLGNREDQLARALHDHAIDEALDAWLEGRHLVGVMGGHDARRGDRTYRDAARLGHGLGAAGLVVATGGGPGAMEAANLGGRLAGTSAATLESAVSTLAAVPAYRPVDDWLTTARAVLAEVRSEHPSLGVPTWFYGHEPANVFATAIAKYFRNALREAVLLRLCDAGIVYLPGAAGTVQEVFQDACENYYATGGPGDQVAPMVLVGVDFWTTTLPAWPLVRALAAAAGHPMQDRVYLVDTVDDAVALLTGTPTAAVVSAEVAGS